MAAACPLGRSETESRIATYTKGNVAAHAVTWHVCQAGRPGAEGCWDSLFPYGFFQWRGDQLTLALRKVNHAREGPLTVRAPRYQRGWVVVDGIGCDLPT